MSRPRSIYVVYMWSIFHFQFYFLHNQSYTSIITDAIVFAHFLEYILLFLDDNVDEQSE